MQDLSNPNLVVLQSSSNVARMEVNIEEENDQPCCCSVFKLKITTIAAGIKNILAAISIIGLVKSLLSLIMFLYDVISKYNSASHIMYLSIIFKLLIYIYGSRHIEIIIS